MGNSTDKESFWPQYPGPCLECACIEFRLHPGSPNCSCCDHPKEQHQGSLQTCKNCDGKGNQTIPCQTKQECNECWGRGWIGFVNTNDGLHKTCDEESCKKAVRAFIFVTTQEGVDETRAVCMGCMGRYSRCYTCTSKDAFFDNGFVPCVKCNGAGKRTFKCMYCINGQVYA